MTEKAWTGDLEGGLDGGLDGDLDGCEAFDRGCVGCAGCVDCDNDFDGFSGFDGSDKGGYFRFFVWDGEIESLFFEPCIFGWLE